MKSFLKPDPDLRNGYKDPKRLAAVAALPCIACKKTTKAQFYRTEVHHLIGRGLGKKASDLETIPLCSFHHVRGDKGEAIHSGKKSFEAIFGTQEELLEETNKMLENKK